MPKESQISWVSDIAAIFITHANKDHYNYLPGITNSLAVNIQSVIIGGVLLDYPAGTSYT